jgi:hypothetical protein
MRIVHPKAIIRAPLPAELPDSFAEDYREACLVLTDSENASAAISRRCLQNLLRENAGVRKGDLNSEIRPTKKPMSAAARKAVSKRMKAYRAKRKGKGQR